MLDPASGQRNLPQPTVLDRFDEDVALGGGRQVRTAAEVAVDGEVAKERIPLLPAPRAGDQGGLAARVHDHAGAHLGAVVQHYAHCAVAFEANLFHGHALVHIRASRPAVIEKNLVETSAPDLIGVGKAPVGLAETPTPWLAVAAPAHGGAGLLHEALGGHRRQHAGLFEDGQRGRQQRFAHVGAGKALALEQHRAQASVGKQRGRRAAGRAATDDRHVRVHRASVAHREHRAKAC